MCFGFVRTIDSYISPSALRWSMANKFIGRRTLPSKRPFSPVESHHTSNYKLDEKRFNLLYQCKRPDGEAVYCCDTAGKMASGLFSHAGRACLTVNRCRLGGIRSTKRSFVFQHKSSTFKPPLQSQEN